MSLKSNCREKKAVLPFLTICAILLLLIGTSFLKKPEFF